MIKQLQFGALAICMLASCTDRPSEGAYTSDIELQVKSAMQTAAMPQKKNDDSADDPALWVHPTDASKSIVYGSNKKGGIAAYNLDGKQVGYYRVGEINNIDVRYDFVLAGDTFDIVAGSNRSQQSVLVMKINADGTLSQIPGGNIPVTCSGEVYGFCLYQNKKHETFAFINTKLGELKQIILKEQQGALAGEEVRSIQLLSQPEGMVSDDSTQLLFVGVEEKGIWKFGAEPVVADTVGVLLDKTSADNNSKIVYDIEGLALYKSTDSTGYLVASIQGNYSYAIYQFEAPHTYIASFRIGEGNGMDAVEETDGIEISNVALPGFPNGIMIAQDGYNYTKRGRKQAQNFKVVNWNEIENIIQP